MLPRQLGAQQAWRFNGEDVKEAINLFDQFDPTFSILPEDFHMVFGGLIDYPVVLDAIKDFYNEYGAVVEILNVSKPKLRVPPGKLIEVKPKNGINFWSVILINQGFVFFNSYTHLP
jgi:hypothetical protein